MHNDSFEAGILRLAAGQKDIQDAHSADELYFVIEGNGFIRILQKDHSIKKGSCIFVPSNAKHYFHGNEDELVVLYVLIISGDLTDDGLYFQFEQAKRELSKFTCKNIIIFPGNHDYRHTGYLLFREFFPAASALGSKVYKFNDPKNHNHNVIITTVGTARADRDEGEVGYRQNLWLNKVLKKYINVRRTKGKDPQVVVAATDNSKTVTKIVAMHHHLIAIPDTGYTNVVGISDAGDVLTTCQANNVDLVICG